MSICRIQGKSERERRVYYEFDTEDTPLGEGGMGKVYKGRCVNEATGACRDVAIKFMYSDLTPYAIEKARREASIHFRHDNLIEMLGFIETEGRSVIGEPQRHYHVVSELLDGITLDNLLEGKMTPEQGQYHFFAEQLHKEYKQDPERFAVKIVKNILSGLIMMHDAGYIHRDIDPTNIMLTKDGHIKLIDFGIAKKVNTLTTHDKHLTQAGQFIGKPEYAAPELVMGAINEQNQTTDIYAVGILLYQCIVGHVPFEGDRAEVLQKQLHNKIPLKQIKSKLLRNVIAKATEKKRSNRYQSAAEFRVALESGSPAPINWKPWAIGGAAVALIGAGLYFLPKFKSGETSTPGSEVVIVDPQPPQIVKTASYADVIKDLYSQATASEALTGLKDLSNSGDANAKYLLSRLYFKSKNVDDICPDSIKRMQAALHIEPDNIHAHELLKEVVNQDTDNYHAIFELACDYWKAAQRTEAVPERTKEIGLKAEQLFLQVVDKAHKSGDMNYVNMSEKYLSDIKRWKKNLHIK